MFCSRVLFWFDYIFVEIVRVCVCVCVYITDWCVFLLVPFSLTSLTSDFVLLRVNMYLFGYKETCYLAFFFCFGSALKYRYSQAYLHLTTEAEQWLLLAFHYIESRWGMARSQAHWTCSEVCTVSYPVCNRRAL